MGPLSVCLHGLTFARLLLLTAPPPAPPPPFAAPEPDEWLAFREVGKSTRRHRPSCRVWGESERPVRVEGVGERPRDGMGSGSRSWGLMRGEVRGPERNTWRGEGLRGTEEAAGDMADAEQREDEEQGMVNELRDCRAIACRYAEDSCVEREEFVSGVGWEARESMGRPHTEAPWTVGVAAALLLDV